MEQARTIFWNGAHRQGWQGSSAQELRNGEPGAWRPEHAGDDLPHRFDYEILHCAGNTSVGGTEETEPAGCSGEVRPRRSQSMAADHDSTTAHARLRHS